MQKPILVLGSIAYDHIMHFSGDVNENLSSDPLKKMFQLAVMPHSKKIVWGGTSGNIGYNLEQLGVSAYIITAVGKDFKDLGYEGRLKVYKHVKFWGDVHDQEHTASCYIVNDVNNNQIIIFHGGAMEKSPEIKLKEKGINKDTVALALLSPDNYLAMKVWAAELEHLEIPFIFDPGQVTPAFSGEDLEKIIPKAQLVIGNEFEISMIQEKLGTDRDGLLKLNPNLIVTMGEKGAICYEQGKERQLHPCKVMKVEDPTGAGDGFRAGLAYGLVNGRDLFTSCKYGSAVGSLVVEKSGPQSQVYSLKEVEERIFSNYD